MTASFPDYTILLSVRSPILAPLYLAKVRGNAFRHINFKYGFELPELRRIRSRNKTPHPGGHPKPTTTDDKISYKRSPVEAENVHELHDVLVEYVLSKSPDKHQYIAGVADPFRCLMQSDGALYKPKILGSLIRHQTFWLASDDPSLKAGSSRDIARSCDIIISQPRYTSGYAVLTDFLNTKNEPMTETDDFSFFNSQIGPKIFHNTLPGFEREYYNRWKMKSCKKGKYAYITTNPADHEGPIAQFAHLPADLNIDYKDTLMSALFCGNGWYCKYPVLFDDLRGDINRAVEALIDDPVRAAIELKEYTRISGDRFMNFSNDEIPHTHLVQIFDDLIRDKIYSPGLSITKDQIRKGVEIRPRFKERAKNEAHSGTVGREDRTPWSQYGDGTDEEIEKFVANYFDLKVIEPVIMEESPPYHDSKTQTVSGDIERTIGMDAFVRVGIRNYRQFADLYYQVDKDQREGRDLQVSFRSAVISWLSLAFLLAFPYPCLILGNVNATSEMVGALPSDRMSNAIRFMSHFVSAEQQYVFFATGLLSCLSLGLLYPAYMVRYTSRFRINLLYDFIMLLTFAIDAAVGSWTVILWLNPQLTSMITSSDKLSLELFYFSSSILLFGGFGIAVRTRLTELWEKNISKWVERRIVASIKRAAPPKLYRRTLRNPCSHCIFENTNRTSKLPRISGENVNE